MLMFINEAMVKDKKSVTVLSIDNYQSLTPRTHTVST